MFLKILLKNIIIFLTISQLAFAGEGRNLAGWLATDTDPMRESTDEIKQVLIPGALGEGSVFNLVAEGVFPDRAYIEDADDQELITRLLADGLRKASGLLISKREQFYGDPENILYESIFSDLVDLQHNLFDRTYLFKGGIHSRDDYVLAFNYSGKVGIDIEFLRKMESSPEIVAQIMLRLLLFYRNVAKPDFDPDRDIPLTNDYMERLFGDKTKDLEMKANEFIGEKLSTGPAEDDASGGVALLASGKALTRQQHSMVNEVIASFFGMGEHPETATAEELGSLGLDEYAGDTKIYIVPGLDEKVREMSAEKQIPYDDFLIAHPGTFKGKEKHIFFNEDALEVFRNMSKKDVKQISMHEIEHVNRIYASEAYIQATRPVAGLLREFNRIFQSKAHSLPREITGPGYFLSPNDIRAIEKEFGAEIDSDEIPRLERLLSILRQARVPVSFFIEEVYPSVKRLGLVLGAEVYILSLRSDNFSPADLVDTLDDFTAVLYGGKKFDEVDGDRKRITIGNYLLIMNRYFELGLEHQSENMRSFMGLEGGQDEDIPAKDINKSLLDAIFFLYSKSSKLSNLDIDFFPFGNIMSVIYNYGAVPETIYDLSSVLDNASYVSSGLVETFFRDGEPAFWEEYNKNAELFSYYDEAREARSPEAIFQRKRELNKKRWAELESRGKVPEALDNEEKIEAHYEYLVKSLEYNFGELTRLHPGKKFLFAFDLDIGKTQGAPFTLLYKAIYKIATATDSNGRSKYPDIHFVLDKSSNGGLSRKIKASIDEEGINKENVFLVVKDVYFKDKYFGFLKGAAWVSKVDDRTDEAGLLEAFRMPLMESLILMIMAANGEDIRLITDFYNSFSFPAIGVEMTARNMGKMISSKEFIIIPKSRSVDYSAIKKQYYIAEKIASMA